VAVAGEHLEGCPGDHRCGVLGVSEGHERVVGAVQHDGGAGDVGRRERPRPTLHPDVLGVALHALAQGVDARLEERRARRRVAEERGVRRRPLERVVGQQAGTVVAVVLDGPRGGVGLRGAVHQFDLVRVVAVPGGWPSHVGHAGHDAAADDSVAEHGGTRHRVRTARRQPDDGEALDAEVIGEGGHIARELRHRAAGLGARRAVAGAVERHHAHALVPRRRLDRAHVEPAAGGAVEVHDHRPVGASAIGEPEGPAVGERHRCIAHGRDRTGAVTSGSR
jgi:hypothetical protein